MAVSEQQPGGGRRIRPPGPRKGADDRAAVCKILQSEFDDVSISQDPLPWRTRSCSGPRGRTSGGYRLYKPVRRSNGLRTILRLQRDEFLPLRG